MYIYIYGPCIVIGVNVEDKHTIASFLQDKLNALGYKYRVENMGAFTGSRLMTINKIAATPLKKGDIVLWYSSNRAEPDINMTDIIEENDLPVNWFMEQLAHCNHNVNKCVAEEIYKKLLPIFQQQKQGWQEKCGVSGIVEWYMQMYFSKFDVSHYEKIGSIVMNCNPFTKGHRYLIEQALNRVDFLIIFVVEEDQSLFSFQERFAMVSYGVSDFENVMVVPSDEIILSRITFPEYFIKERDEDIIQNMENDITIFAERIAPVLNITYRFIGEEPKDVVTGEYNKVMKRILPSYGIKVVEIPRLEIEGDVISASRVRTNFDNHGDNVEILIPDSTKEILYCIGF